MLRLNRRFIQKTVKHFMKNQCVITKNHLTPEISLSILTPECPQYHLPLNTKQYDFEAPFWSIYWSGGQGITRYLIDHIQQFSNLSCLDVGTGCGVSAIALYLLGNNIKVVANDIDDDSLISARLNLELNKLEYEQFSINDTNEIEFNNKNYLLNQNLPELANFDIFKGLLYLHWVSPKLYK